MNTSEQLPEGNDYAVAKALNEEILAIIVIVVMVDLLGEPKDFRLAELNRSYILLVHELETLYERNPNLNKIKPEPIWKHFDVLQTATWEINEFLEDEENDMGQAHIARVNRLCILSDIKEPIFSEKQSKLIDYAKKVFSEYGAEMDKLNRDSLAQKASNWQIPKYHLTYRLDGTIWINDLLKIKKANAGSTTERLMEQAIKRPGELFIPDLNGARNLSTIISSAGFTQTTKGLFFPTVSSKGIVFRQNITADQARADNIDTTELDLLLKNLGAETEPFNSI